MVFARGQLLVEFGSGEFGDSPLMTGERIGADHHNDFRDWIESRTFEIVAPVAWPPQLPMDYLKGSEPPVSAPIASRWPGRGWQAPSSIERPGDQAEQEKAKNRRKAKTETMRKLRAKG